MFLTRSDASSRVADPLANQIAAKEHGRVYVLFDSEDSCKKARDALNGRTFDGNKVIATFVSAEDFARAQQGEWLAPPPEDEGVVRLRGLAPTTGKVDIASLFADLALAPLRDQDVRLVVGPNGQPSGDAYVLLRGSGWQRALLKNGAVLQSRLVEVAASNLDVRCLSVAVSSAAVFLLVGSSPLCSELSVFHHRRRFCNAGGDAEAEAGDGDGLSSLNRWWSDGNSCESG